MDRRQDTYTETLRAARGAWPDGDADDVGEAVAAAVDAQESAAYDGKNWTGYDADHRSRVEQADARKRDERARAAERLPLTGQVLVRMPARTAAHVRALAAADDLTAAAWCRRALCAAAGAPAADAVPVRAYRPPLPIAPAHVLEIARLREHAAELCGALVRAAIRSRQDDRDEAHAEIDALLPKVRAAVRDLDRLKIAAMGERA